jgi:hypothetical protein
MQPQGAPMLGYCCELCHRFMQTLANSTVAGIPQWPVLPQYSSLAILRYYPVLPYCEKEVILTPEFWGAIRKSQ